MKNFLGEKFFKAIRGINLSKEDAKKLFVTKVNARRCFEKGGFALVEWLRTTTAPKEIEEVPEDIHVLAKKAGYRVVGIDSEAALKSVRHYYNGEPSVICTYNDVKGRLSQYHIIVMIRENIDEIKRGNTNSGYTGNVPSNGKVARRDDDYGISILNIQIHRKDGHMSIKNRYNHSVDNCDCTLGNNLDSLGVRGLQAAAYRAVGMNGVELNQFDIDGLVYRFGVVLAYHLEVNNFYFGNFVIGNDSVMYTDTGRYIVADNFVIDMQEKKILDPANTNDGFIKCAQDSLDRGDFEIEFETE